MTILNPLDFATNAQKIREAIDFAKAIGEAITFVVFVASAVNNKLPRWEEMTEGRGQRFYKNYVVPTMAFLALNWRKRLPSLNWSIGPFKDSVPCSVCGHVHEPATTEEKPSL